MTTIIDISHIRHGLPLKEIKDLGGELYLVGGFVRDLILGKTPKDLDVIITGVKFDVLSGILTKHGRMDLVGESFGIIKFKSDLPCDYDDIDIALPRKERKISEGYQGFNIESDPFMPIELDLLRRDITINAIAINIDGYVVDPYGGISDISNGIIRMVNVEAFNEDPLRMLRCIQFASRFNFTIDTNTWTNICNNSYKIKEISVERWLIELEKICSKGNIRLGAKLLIFSGLYENMFRGVPMNLDMDDIFPNSSHMTMADFIYTLLSISNGGIIPSTFYKNVLKGDIDTFKAIKAIEYMISNKEHKGKYTPEAMLVIFEVSKITPDVLNTMVFENMFMSTYISMRLDNIPTSLKELAINGDDIMELTGFTGKLVGDTLSGILLAIYRGELTNDRDSILKYVEND